MIPLAVIIMFYVDDRILTGDEQLINYCKEDLPRDFEMEDMGLFTISLVWRYGSVMGSYLFLKESMPKRF